MILYILYIKHLLQALIELLIFFSVHFIIFVFFVSFRIQLLHTYYHLSHTGCVIFVFPVIIHQLSSSCHLFYFRFSCSLSSSIVFFFVCLISFSLNMCVFVLIFCPSFSSQPFQSLPYHCADKFLPILSIASILVYFVTYSTSSNYCLPIAISIWWFEFFLKFDLLYLLFDESCICDQKWNSQNSWFFVCFVVSWSKYWICFYWEQLATSLQTETKTVAKVVAFNLVLRGSRNLHASL